MQTSATPTSFEPIQPKGGSGLIILVALVIAATAFVYHHRDRHIAAANCYNAAQCGSGSFTGADAGAIYGVLAQQATDWNRGDLDSFATGYKNSPDILFIGKHISRGYAQMLESYKHGYPTREKMGTLSFSDLEVQPLSTPLAATATGYFHLERTAAGGGNADGYFLLVFEKTPAGWKIVRDDTTATLAPAKP